MENFLSDEQTVGTILKKERERQYKSIRDIADTTHIRVVFLENIESDHFDELPSKLHITGFLKVYSHCLGLDEQEILSKYKKQMLLLQDLPSEEIFAISGSTFSYKKKNWVLFLSLFLVGFCVFLAGIFYKQYYKQVSIPENILTDTNNNIIITAQEGEEFSFFIKGKEITYRIVGFTDRSVSLLNISSKTIIPPFLFSEALEYDMDEDQVYDYRIQVLEAKDHSISFDISQISNFRNPGQFAYAIIQRADSAIDVKDDISVGNQKELFLQNIGFNKVFILFVDLKGNTSRLDLNPMQREKIEYFDAENNIKYSAIYIQDIYSISIKIHNTEIKNSSSQKGALGILTCSIKRDTEEPSCQVITGKNYL